MIKTILTTFIVLFAGSLAFADNNTATYKITSDGTSKFEALVDVRKGATCTVSNKVDAAYIRECNSTITQNELSETSVLLTRVDEAIEADLVNVYLQHSKLEGFRLVEGQGFSIQHPIRKGFSKGTDMTLKVGTKLPIIKDAQSGESWFIERVK